MPYAGQTWTDGVTPLDATHMNALDAGVVGAVDVDNVVAAASQIVANKLLAADAQPAFKILGDGKHQWGPGGATAPDVNLYRNAGYLWTDSYTTINAGLRLTLDSGAGTSGIRFGSADDTNLYRSAAGTLKTDGNVAVSGSLSTVGFAQINSNAGATVSIGNLSNWGVPGSPAGLIFGSALDTNLYRSAANHLKSDGFIHAGLNITAFDGGGATQVSIGNYGPASQATLLLGGDTNLYRQAAGVLKTDGGLNAGGFLTANHGGATTQVQVWTDGKIYFGTAVDTNLYRTAANTIRTDGAMHVGGPLAANLGAGAQVFIGDGGGNVATVAWGNTMDCKIWRIGAADLQSESGLRLGVGKALTLVSAGGNVIAITGNLYGGVGGSTNSLYVTVDGVIYRLPIYAA